MSRNREAVSGRVPCQCIGETLVVGGEIGCRSRANPGQQLSPLIIVSDGHADRRCFTLDEGQFNVRLSQGSAVLVCSWRAPPQALQDLDGMAETRLGLIRPA